MGATPKWLLTTALLPENRTTEALVRRIMAQIHDACAQFDITLCGGHTEVTHGLDRPIVIGQMLGEVKKDQLVVSSNAQVGDDLILTKGLGIEATSIIARERESDLRERFPDDFIARAKGYLRAPGISVVREALIAAEVGGVHAMHDPTEGGVATAIHELAHAANLGAVIWEDKLIVPEETSALCEAFQLNPLGVISSGALLISAAPNQTRAIMSAISAQDIACEVIGRLLPAQEGLWIEQSGRRRALPLFETDEITKIFAEA